MTKKPKVDVEPTATAIDDMAGHLEASAERLRHVSRAMREDGDLTRAADAASAIATLLPRLRLDLLIVRPLRAVGVK